MAKKKINYVNGEIPDNIGDVLANADEQDLRILSLLLMAANADGEIDEKFSCEEMLGLSKSEVDASLKFWRGAGVIGSANSHRKKDAEKTEEPIEKAEMVSKIKYAHKDGAVESNVSEIYGSRELATLLHNRAVTADFIDEAQKVFGKTFTTRDTSIVVRLIDEYGFDEESVLMFLEHVRANGKKGVAYAEKIALGFYDDGITAIKDVEARFADIERSKELVFKIKKMFGFGARELTKLENELFTKWTRDYGYGEDVIKLAYDIMINAIQKVQPKYADKILEKWHVEGLRTAEEIEKYESEKRGAQKTAQSDPQKSYDLDDFFEAAMKRSFEELK